MGISYGYDGVCRGMGYWYASERTVRGKYRCKQDFDSILFELQQF